MSGRAALAFPRRAVQAAAYVSETVGGLKVREEVLAGVGKLVAEALA